MSYIISNGKVIAKTLNHYKSKEILFSYAIVKETMDTSRLYNLLGCNRAQISNAKKWEIKWEKTQMIFAIEINKGEFLIYID